MVFQTILLSSSPSLTPAKLTVHNALLQSPSSSILFPAKPVAELITFRTTRRCRATPTQKFVYPDPIPEFAAAETGKFRDELLKKLSEEKEMFGDDLHAVVEVCSEIFGEFLSEEYGGPGTLLVEPFTDIFIALNQKKLPGAPLAARSSLLWAQNYLDQDWKTWNSTPTK